MGKRRLYRAARAAQGASPDAPPTWGERLAALQHVPPLVRLVYQTHRGYTISILLLRAIRSFIPVAVLWIGKLIIDAVIAGVATVRAGGLPDWWHLAVLIALELGIAVVGEGLARLSSLLESLLGDLFANRLSVRLMRHADLSEKFYQENKQLSIRRNIVSTLLVTLGTLGYYGAYVVIIYRTVLGVFSIGTLTFLAGSFRQSRSLIQSVLISLSSIYEQSLYLSDLFTFFDVQPTVTSKPGARAVPKPLASGFRFENVGFRYPGSQRWAVRGLTFAFEPHERIALVGENGAGKTTL